ncbi:MAG: hypothetical protein ACREP2_11940 [Rhodanobacteraceae bacterium]
MRQSTPAVRPARRSPGIRRSYAPSSRRAMVASSFPRRDGRTAVPKSRGHAQDSIPDPILLGAATWLACGVVLLGLTPLPLRGAALGWSPAFWLLAAPAILLLARCIFEAAIRSRFCEKSGQGRP